jgi:hypothetical protein
MLTGSSRLNTGLSQKFPAHQITSCVTASNWSATYPSVKIWWCMNYHLIVLLGRARVAVIVHACVSYWISEASPTLSITYGSVHIWVDKYRKGLMSSEVHYTTEMIYWCEPSRLRTRVTLTVNGLVLSLTTSLPFSMSTTSCMSSPLLRTLLLFTSRLDWTDTENLGNGERGNASSIWCALCRNR